MKKTLVTIEINGMKIMCTHEQAMEYVAIASNGKKATSNIESSSKTSTKSQKKTPKKSAPKSSKVNLADFEPKKDADGHYNWASYKACRRRYVEEVSGKTLHGKDGEWLEGETFKKFAEDFDKAYKYVKKSDR